MTTGTNRQILTSVREMVNYFTWFHLGCGNILPRGCVLIEQRHHHFLNLTPQHSKIQHLTIAKSITSPFKNPKQTKAIPDKTIQERVLGFTGFSTHKKHHIQAEPVSRLATFVTPCDCWIKTDFLIPCQHTNVLTSPSVELPPLPPSEKDTPLPAATGVIKAMGGLKRLRRASAMIEPMRQDSRRFPCMLDHSDGRDFASCYAAVTPASVDIQLPDLGAVNVANTPMMNALGSSEGLGQSHLLVDTGAMHDENEGTVVWDFSPDNSVGGASQTGLQSGSNSSSQLGTPVIAPTATGLDKNEDTMSWRAARQDMSTSRTTPNPFERVSSESRCQACQKGSTLIEDTSPLVPDEYYPALRLSRNDHVPVDFECMLSGRERAAMDTSQKHPVTADQALEVQTGRTLRWNTQGACNRTSTHTNDCQRCRDASEMRFASDDTDITIVLDRLTIETTTIGLSGRATFAGTEDGSTTGETLSSGEDIPNLANVGSRHPVHGCFREQVAKTSLRPTGGRKRGLWRSPLRNANLERTAKRPRGTSAIWRTNDKSVGDMAVCMDVVMDTNDTSSRTVPRFSTMDSTCIRQDEHESGSLAAEPNAMDTSSTIDSWSSIADQIHDVAIWSEENGFEEPVMYPGERSRYESSELSGCGSTEADGMQDLASGDTEDENIRQRARDSFTAASDYARSYLKVDTWDASSRGEMGYRVRERGQNAYWEAEDDDPFQRDAMRDITSEHDEASDRECGHDAKRDATEYDAHGVPNARVEDAFSRRDHRNFQEADAMQVVANWGEAGSVKRGKHAQTRVRNARKPRRTACSVYQPAKANAFKPRKRRTRGAGRSSNGKQAQPETWEPMSIG